MAACLLPDFQVCHCDERDTLLEILFAEHFKHGQEPSRTEEADKGACKMWKDADLCRPCVLRNVTEVELVTVYLGPWCNVLPGPSNSRIGQALDGNLSQLKSLACLHMSPPTKANAAREYLDKHNLVEFTQLLVQSASR